MMGLSAAFSRAMRPALLVGVLALVVPVAAWLGAALEASQVGDAQVKAAFLFNFVKFVEWPESDGPIVIGIVGDDSFAETVSLTVHGRSVNGRPLEVRRLTIGADTSGCQILFVGVMKPYDSAELIRQIREPVLTVGDAVQFLHSGGMVRFYVENKRLRFQISQKNAQAAGLKISSRLLALATPAP